ncbi:MAG: arylsulfatase [Roseibacillus sp.]|nr:arylsulfatase [Roseibacillus sp.]
MVTSGPMSRCLFAFLVLIHHGPVIAGDLPSRPNIIWIMCDDLGYGDLGCFGQKTIATPRLDQLAREGMRFTDFYAGCTVCRPSRLSLWTGQHMGHTPISSNASYHFRPGDVTVAELLKGAGYRTGGVGKWAMGGVETSGFPLKNGFDFWMGYLDQGQAHNYYPTHLWRNGQKYPLPGNVLSDHPKARGRVASRKGTWSHPVMTEQAFAFIRESGDQPFLLHVHWTIPHANNEGGRVHGDGMEVPDYGIYKEKDWANTSKGQAAMVSWMDRDVGRLVDLLRELKLDRRTLVIFTSDNGPHSEGGHRHEVFDANGPLRGFKRDLYEGGIRVPTLAWWPGVVEAGTTCSEPLAFWDFLPTACELAGAKVPAGLDGVSFVNALRGMKQRSHDYLYWKYGRKEALRAGKWKLVRTDPVKPAELYDLKGDPGEKRNVAGEHQKMVQTLQNYLGQAKK